MTTSIRMAALVLALAAPVCAEETAPAAASAKPAEDAAPALPGRISDVLVAADSASAPTSLRENSYFYSAFGTTDPFRSLLAGDFEAKKQDIVDIHTVQLVGVIWEPDEIAAMVQDAQGYGYTLRPGDVVKNGTVVAVKHDALVARLNVFGQTTQVTLHLQRDDEE